MIKFIIIIFSLFPTIVFGFSFIPDKTTIHTRKQMAVSYGIFNPGNNWRSSSAVVNDQENAPVVFGRQIKIRYEHYGRESFDYRLGADIQGISDNNLMYSAVLLIAELTNNLWRRKKYRIISVASLGYSPKTLVITDDDQLQGTSYKYGLSFEWAYAFAKSWSAKLGAGYQYQKLSEFPTTTTFDPSFMTIRGFEADLGINYVF